MKSPIAKRMLKAGIILAVAYIALVLLAGALLSFGDCSGGRLIMNPTPGTEPPVTCARIPDGLGLVANEITYSAFGVVLFSPVFIIVWGLLTLLPELSERNRLKREKD